MRRPGAPAHPLQLDAETGGVLRSKAAVAKRRSEIARAAVEQHPPEHPRVAEDQGAPARVQHEVIVLGRLVAHGCGLQFPAHAQMKSQGGAVREAEDHLLRRGLRSLQPRPGDHPSECGRVRAAEDPGPGMQRHARDPLPRRRLVPAPAVELDFGQFRHARMLVPEAPGPNFF